MSGSLGWASRWSPRHARRRARTTSMLRAAAALVSTSWILVFVASPAVADGAFPTPFRIFTPSARPDDVTVTATYGLILTRDGGRTWAWMCEHGPGLGGAQYQQSAVSQGRFVGVAAPNLIVSDDDACSWAVSTGFPASEIIDDNFIDPSNPQHVLAIGHDGAASNPVFELFASQNGGNTFSTGSLYQTAAGTRLDGVEIAASDPSRVYLTTSPWRADQSVPGILRSEDAGRTFSLLPPAAGLLGGVLRILAVDRDDPNKIYLRLLGDDDRLLISTDGGYTVRTALIAAPGRALTAFLRRADGSVLAASFDDSAGTLFRSLDGGNTFTPLSPSLHVASMAERAGLLYLLADEFKDGLLVGTSRDGGDTVDPFLDASAVMGVEACGADLRAACADSCTNVLVASGLFPAGVCKSLVSVRPAVTSPASSGSGGGCAVAESAFFPSSDSDSRARADIVSMMALAAWACRRSPRARSRRQRCR